MRISGGLAAIFAALIWAMPAGAAGLSGKARVIDGDTLAIGDTRIRLDGIDAPELAQRCGRASCGEEASRALSEMIHGLPVTCDPHGTDAYGRVIATCRTAEGVLNARLVREGRAVAYRQYSTAYVAQETEARRARRGLWAEGEPQMPWEFRRASWTAANRAAPEADCPIKGNISASGRIYHTPWSPHYARTRIDPARGERWFCSESEAIAAGWRPPRG